MDRNLNIAVILHLLQGVETALPTLTLSEGWGSREDLEFIQHKTGDNQPPVEKPGGQNPWNPPIHDNVRVKEQGLSRSRILAKPDIGNDESKIIPAAPHGKNRAKKSQTGKEEDIQAKIYGSRASASCSGFRPTRILSTASW